MKSRILRTDFKQARQIQEREELERQLEHERMMEDVARQDEEIAKQMHEQLIEEDAAARKEKNAIEEEDKKLAQILYQKEKKRLKKRKLQRERLQVEKIRLESAETLNPELLHSINQIIAQLETDTLDPQDDLNDFDLSEFCLKPPPNLSEDELKLFMVEQDEELARFLQQYEMKRRAHSLKEKQILIEAQDFEIARRLQEKEKEKAKRLKEKARQKAMLKQQQQQQQLEAASSVPEVVGAVGGLAVYDIEETERSMGVNEMNPSHYIVKDDLDETNEEAIKFRALPPIPAYHNVAMDLDPTYKRENKGSQTSIKEFNGADQNVSGIHFAQLCRVSPCSSDSQSSGSTLNSTLNSKLKYNNKSASSEPSTLDSRSSFNTYCPVQGQRRISTNEKPRHKKSRDTCRTH